MSHATPDQRPESALASHSHHRFWPRRLPHRLTPPSTSLWENLAVNAQRYPQKPAIVFFDHVLTYRELHEQAERLAAYLCTLGVQSGDRVVLLMQNCPQWVVAHFAILRANAVVVPVNPMNQAEELRHTLLDPDVRVAICAADLAQVLVQASDALPSGQQLLHLVVTHYSDAMGPAAQVPETWQTWLSTRHPLPAMSTGRATDWAQALACEHAPRTQQAP